MRNILVSQPNLYTAFDYLPYVYACLKSEAEKSEEVRTHFHWLRPIYKGASAKTLYEPYRDTPVDVLGLSCYTWNSDRNFQLAKLVKQNNPECLVIAGGPDPDYQDPTFFEKYPVDMILRQDGEVAFRRILETIVSNSKNFSSIPGLILSDGRWTGPPEQPRDFSTSPYQAQGATLHSVLTEVRQSTTLGGGVLWETNRGCPFSCSFCDWGSNTMSKIRPFSIERIKEDLRWFGENKIERVHSCDANFGMLQRDVEIAQLLAETKKQYGYPLTFYYNPTKNKVDRSVEIAKILFDAELISSYAMGIQHTDPRVLEIMERKNLPVVRQKNIIEKLVENNVPCSAQMILGAPGDTPVKWQKALTDILEWGVHDDITSYAYNVLPNAPAGSKSYKDKWRIRTIDRYCYMIRRPKELPTDSFSKIKYVVDTYSYTTDEWVDMYLFDAMLRAFHVGGVTKFVAQFLREFHDIRYFDFYSKLFHSFFEVSTPIVSDIYKKCRAHLNNFVNPDGSVLFEEMELDLFPSQNYYRVEEVVLIHALLNWDQLWQHLTAWLYDNYSELTYLDDLIKFQKEVVITPDYNRKVGRTLPVTYNWPEYFQRKGVRKRQPPQAVQRPLVAKDQGTGPYNKVPLGWHEEYPDQPDEKMRRYVDLLVGIDYTRTGRTLLKDFE